jgi:ribA/ribD-fused uncharacterized protein
MIDSFSGKYRFLSNFYSGNPVLLDGEWFPSAEHAFHAMKTTNREDWLAIRNAGSPGEAKRLGRRVSLRPGWEDFRLQAMETVLRAKFSHRGLAQKLMDTGDEELVEGNAWGDTFWGVSGGIGHNHLGRLLMRLRSELKEQ